MTEVFGCKDVGVGSKDSSSFDWLYIILKGFYFYLAGESERYLGDYSMILLLFE